MGIAANPQRDFACAGGKDVRAFLHIAFPMTILVLPEVVVDSAAWAALVLHCEQGAGMGRSCS
jgi:hypothetical protein